MCRKCFQWTINYQAPDCFISSYVSLEITLSVYNVLTLYLGRTSFDNVQKYFTGKIRTGKDILPTQ